MNLPDQLPPQARDIERAIIGAMLIDRECIGLVTEHITEQDFYAPANAAIFAMLVELDTKGIPTDQLTVSEELRKIDKLDMIGGERTLSGLISETASSANVIYHCRAVKDKYIKRRIITSCNAIIGDAYEGKKDGDELLFSMERLISEVGGGVIKDDDYSAIGDNLVELLAEISKNNTEGHRFPGIDTGMPKLNGYLGGFQKGRVTIIAGKTSEGKSALALEFAITAAQHGHPVGIISLEMTTAEIRVRTLQNQSLFSLNEGYSRKIEAEEMRLLSDGANRMYTLPLYVSDKGGLTITELLSRTKRMCKEKNIEMLIVDYLQLVVGRGTSREQEVANVSRNLKALALQLDISVIALSQFSRAADRRDGSPELSDLRESGAIEQDADTVLMVYSRHKSIEDEDYHDYSQGDLNKNIRELFIKKNRGGATNKKILLYTDLRYGWMKELSLAGKYQVDAEMRRQDSERV